MRLALSSRSGPILALSLGLLIAAPVADAQCTGPDNLSGPCCTVVGPNLPAFSSVQLPGLGICWSNCSPAALQNLVVTWPTPAWIECSEYVTQINVSDANTGAPVLTGKLHLSYTRTWEEIDSSGAVHQVWRFAAKADLASAAVGVVPVCPTPKCLPPFATQPTAFFYGYVDYASLCGSAITRQSAVLYHACDFFVHRPGLSSRPGAFHPTESYAIVAPHSITQPFVASNSPSPSGPMILEGSREFVNIAGGGCQATDRLFAGQIAALGGLCVCPPGPVPAQHTFRVFKGDLSCVDAIGLQGNFQALNIGFPNLLPWYHLVTTNIGRWTNPNQYPGTERAWVDEGLFIQKQGCSGDWVSIQYGASTRGGWFINHPVLIDSFTDLADNWTAPLLGPYTFPIMGNIETTDRVLFVNTP